MHFVEAEHIFSERRGTLHDPRIDETETVVLHPRTQHGVRVVIRQVPETRMVSERCDGFADDLVAV